MTTTTHSTRAAVHTVGVRQHMRVEFHHQPAWTMHVKRIESFPELGRLAAVNGRFHPQTPRPLAGAGSGAFPVVGRRFFLSSNPQRWVKQLSLPPGRYEYRIVVDRDLVSDAAAAEQVLNPHGSFNAVLVVRRM